MKIFTRGIVFLLLLGALSACSRKKNTFLNRNWHAVTTEYNTLYNGDLALELGREELNANYLDNYWGLLPVERMHVREAVLAPGEQINPNFAVAEEKAVKAIQRHSMLIEGSEKNPQVDEAYLLLGKARYYDQRFVPALEAFNYILHKYPLSNTINEARIWREKTNMRLEFEEVAIKNLKKILELKNLQKKDRAEAAAVLAQAYINTNAADSAVTHMRTAAQLTNVKDKQGRYWFITGQLHDILGQPEQASIAFSKVIELNRKIPRIYLVNAMIRQIDYQNATTSDKNAVLAQLMKMANDRENRPYLDKIYFELGDFHYGQDSTGLAMEYYKRSLREESNNDYLHSLNYETLGNISFDATQYKAAGAYYDSTLVKLPEHSREFRLIKKKRENLADVIYYENSARVADSILYLASLSQEEQLNYFTEYTSVLKEKAAAIAKPEREQVAQDFFENKRPAAPGIPTPGFSFYFYNPTAVAYGKQEFFRTWGNRALADNWRTSRGGAAGSETLAEEAAVELLENNPKFDPQTYMSRIPTDKALLDSLNADLNYASYQLGLIYKEKFNEQELAAARLEFLLNNNPEERLLLPALYHLYKINTDLGNLARAQALKNDILSRYPKSRYAAILNNPEALRLDENNPTAQYEILYKKYEQQQFATVITEAENRIEQLAGDEIIPKLELLKALAAGRLYGFEKYKESLNYVALNYPQSIEGKKAKDLMTNMEPSMGNPAFTLDSLDTTYKLVFRFDTVQRENAQLLQEEIQKILDKNKNARKLSFDVFDAAQDFVVVHGFTSAATAESYYNELTRELPTLPQAPHFYISNRNYKTLQIHKNMEAYNEFSSPPQLSSESKLLIQNAQ